MIMHTLQASAARFSGATSALPRTETLRLNRGEALTLRTPKAGTLRVQQGRVWATLCCATEGRESDHFVTLGHDLVLTGDSAVVLESWPLADGQSALVQWLPAA
ncbi:MAG: hypothetical protein CFE44_24225 [Burkholderiales bacterium PBB4]|nr:MAG: hypothetical protein CFE44_24225 [Burkholderiales bacterium PBB4]